MIKNRIETKNKKKSNCRYGEDIGTAIFFTFIVTCGLLFIILDEVGAFDTPYEELGIERDDVAYAYVVEQYPQYEGCDIHYYKGANKEKVKIKCLLEDEGGLKKTYPNEVEMTYYFEFTDKTLNEYFLEDYNKNDCWSSEEN